MVNIMVPVMAAFEDDLKTNLKLLEEIVKPAGHRMGLEVIGKPSHFLEQEGRQKMIDNLGRYATGLLIVSHQWSGNVIYNPSPKNPAFADLRTKRGARVLECGVAFAEEAINTGIVGDEQEVYVHTHGGELYFNRMNRKELEKNRGLIIQNLLNAASKNPRISVGLENLPLFPNSDDPYLLNNPKKIGRSVFETLMDYRAAVQGTNLKLTFDTAHYAYNLYEGTVDLASAVDIFGAYLKHIHVSDARGIWIPYVSVAGDGYIPGEGKIGEKEFKRFFRHLRDHFDMSEINIEAEVKDDDYSNPQNRAETLKRIIKWLG